MSGASAAWSFRHPCHVPHSGARGHAVPLARAIPSKHGRQVVRSGAQRRSRASLSNTWQQVRFAHVSLRTLKHRFNADNTPALIRSKGTATLAVGAFQGGRLAAAQSLDACLYNMSATAPSTDSPGHSRIPQTASDGLWATGTLGCTPRGRFRARCRRSRVYRADVAGARCKRGAKSRDK